METPTSEWGFKQFLRNVLRDVPWEDFPYHASDEGLNPCIYCGESMPKKDVDFTSAF